MKTATKSNMIRVSGGIVLLTLLFVGMQSPLFGQQNILIPRGDIWKYDATGADLGTAWKETGFDDSGWASDPATIGYESASNTAVTIVTELTSGTEFITYYFRHEFTVTDPASLNSFLLHGLFDDGWIVYLNGTEVNRESMPGDAVNFSTLALIHEAEYWEIIDLTAPAKVLLTAGTNVIAIELHQSTATSSDLVFDAELEAGSDKIVHAAPINGGLWKYNASGADLGTAWKETGFDDTGWSSGPAPLGHDSDRPPTTELPIGIITHYYRTTFAFADDPSEYDSMMMLAYYDDGFVAYLNGQEIARKDLIEGEIDYLTQASSHEADHVAVIDVTEHLDKLVQGNNVLAVETHQSEATSSDALMAVDLLIRDGEGTGVLHFPELATVPQTLVLHPNFPNPFNPVTTIRFDLPQNNRGYHDIRLEIFDLQGKKVRSLLAGKYLPGSHSAQWNAKDDAGNPVSSGIYVYRLTSNSTITTNRMILLR